MLSLNARGGEEWGRLWAALGHQHGPMQQPRPGTSAWLLVVTCATNIDSDLCCCKSTDSDLELSGPTGLDITMASDGSAGLSHVSPFRISPRVSSLTCLHSAQIILLLFSSTPYLSIIVTPEMKGPHAYM